MEAWVSNTHLFSFFGEISFNLFQGANEKDWTQKTTLDTHLGGGRQKARDETLIRLDSFLDAVGDPDLTLQEIVAFLPNRTITNAWWNFKDQIEVLQPGPGSHPLVIASCPQYNETFNPGMEKDMSEDNRCLTHLLLSSLGRIWDHTPLYIDFRPDCRKNNVADHLDIVAVSQLRIEKPDNRGIYCTFH